MPNNYHSLPGKPTSLWLDTTPETDFPTLKNSLTADIAIIGGGLAGLTAATLLKAHGKTVAVLESLHIVQGVTGYTTAKITSLHTLIYDYLIGQFGLEKARAYADANQAAIEQIAQLVQERQIDCDFTRTEAYTYTEKEDQIAQIRAEVDAALQLGLPAVFTDSTPLPFPVKAAVRFDNQAQFHPRKYLLALAGQIQGEGSYIFEDTRVMAVDEEEGSCRVTTEQGAITAQDVIIASHFPFNDKTLYASRLHPFRSYVLGMRIEGAAPRGMFISTDPAYSVRTHPTRNGELVLVGGEKHTAGQGGDTVARYQRLEQWARARFAVKSIDYRWSTQDNRTLDHVPYIGLSTPLSKHVYVATGFGGWGMTNSTVAGMLLSDLILGKVNAWTDVYDPNRLNLESVPELIKQTTEVVQHFVSDRMPGKGADSLAPGEGRVVHTTEGKIALYKSGDGAVTRLSPICTHMGCVVHWNPAEKSWDCPCHGSRFTVDGKVIHGPAIAHLEKLEEVNPMLNNTDSIVNKVALIFGIAYALAGLLGFLPGLVQAPDPTPALGVETGYGKLLGLFPVNILHNLVHLAIGAWGIVASRTVSASLQFSRSVAIFYGLLTVLGLIPATNTLFGLVPIYGHDVWLHAASAVVLAYFGFMGTHPASVAKSSSS